MNWSSSATLLFLMLFHVRLYPLSDRTKSGILFYNKNVMKLNIIVSFLGLRLLTRIITGRKYYQHY